MTTTDAASAARELHAAGGFGGVTLPAVLGDDLFEQWAAQVRSNPAYHLRDPDDPSDEGSTGSSGGSPMPSLIVQYGDGPNDYIATSFDAGQVIVQDGNDQTGRAWKFPEADWRRFVAKVRGEELPDDEKEEGDTQYEAAAKQNARTFGLLAEEREHGNQGATGHTVKEAPAPAKSANTGKGASGKN